MSTTKINEMVHYAAYVLSKKPNRLYNEGELIDAILEACQSPRPRVSTCVQSLVASEFCNGEFSGGKAQKIRFKAGGTQGTLLTENPFSTPKGERLEQINNISDIVQYAGYVLSQKPDHTYTEDELVDAILEACQSPRPRVSTCVQSLVAGGFCNSEFSRGKAQKIRFKASGRQGTPGLSIRYVLELATMSGESLGDERWTLFESDTPLPIPNVGDRIVLQGEGSAATVINRELHIVGTNPTTMHYQLFCKDASPMSL